MVNIYENIEETSSWTKTQRILTNRELLNHYLYIDPFFIKITEIFDMDVIIGKSIKKLSCTSDLRNTITSHVNYSSSEFLLVQCLNRHASY